MIWLSLAGRLTRVEARVSVSKYWFQPKALVPSVSVPSGMVKFVPSLLGGYINKVLPSAV